MTLLGLFGSRYCELVNKHSRLVSLQSGEEARELAKAADKTDVKVVLAHVGEFGAIRDASRVAALDTEGFDLPLRGQLTDIESQICRFAGIYGEDLQFRLQVLQLCSQGVLSFMLLGFNRGIVRLYLVSQLIGHAPSFFILRSQDKQIDEEKENGASSPYQANCRVVSLSIRLHIRPVTIVV